MLSGMQAAAVRPMEMFVWLNSVNIFITFPGSLLLESKINPNTAYQKQQASIFTRSYFFLITDAEELFYVQSDCWYP